MKKEDLLKLQPQLKGMTVLSADGEKLGSVVLCGEEGFVIEEDFFFPEDFKALYRDVAKVRGTEITLHLSRLQLIAQDTTNGVTHSSDESFERRSWESHRDLKDAG